jgi:hypothetical protein
VDVVVGFVVVVVEDGLVVVVVDLAGVSSQVVFALTGGGRGGGCG